MRRAFYAALSLAVRLLQAILIPVRHQYCYLSSPDFSDNAFYVFRAALGRSKSLRHVWLVNSPATRTNIETYLQTHGLDSRQVVIADKRSMRGFVLFLMSHVVFHTHGVYPFVRSSHRRVVVNLWHGMPIKQIGALNVRTPNPYPTYGDLHIASSQVFRYIIAAAFSASPERVIVVRPPRVDGLVEYSSRAADMMKRLGLSGYEGVIAWLPTYRTESGAPTEIRSFLDETEQSVLEKLDDYCCERNLVVLVKLHPYDRLNHCVPTLPWSAIRVVTSDQWNTSGVQLYEFLSITRGLISDISSVVFDYAYNCKPIGSFPLHTEAYPRDLILGQQSVNRDLGVLDISSEAGMKAFCESIDSGSGRCEGSGLSLLVDRSLESGAEVILRHVANT